MYVEAENFGFEFFPDKPVTLEQLKQEWVLVRELLNIGLQLLTCGLTNSPKYTSAISAYSQRMDG